MFFSRVTLKSEASRENKAQSLFNDLYSIHKAVWRLCANPDDKKRTFLYRQDRFDRRPVLYIVSLQPPKDSNGVWSIETKPYTPKISTREKLGFMLKVNAVIKKKDQYGKGHRHDVIMDAKKIMQAEQPRVGWKNQAEITQEVGLKWLTERSKRYGFDVEERSVQVYGYRQHELFKKGVKPLRFSTIDYRGLLHVNDPESFKKVLFQGIGKSKAFGCGLMMIRRL